MISTRWGGWQFKMEATLHLCESLSRKSKQRLLYPLNDHKAPPPPQFGLTMILRWLTYLEHKDQSLCNTPLWRPFLDPHLTTCHSNKGVHLR